MFGVNFHGMLSVLGTSFNLVWFLSYSSSLVISPKIFTGHLPLVCFQYLLYSANYLLNLLLVSVCTVFG